MHSNSDQIGDWLNCFGLAKNTRSASKGNQPGAVVTKQRVWARVSCAVVIAVACDSCMQESWLLRKVWLWHILLLPEVMMNICVGHIVAGET